MSKKYYWIIDGRYYEVSKETYQKLRRDHDHSKRLEKYEKEVVVLSLDALATEENFGHEVIADENVNVEEEAVHNIMLENLRKALMLLSDEESELIKMLFEKEMSDREIAKILGISHTAVRKRREKILSKLKVFLEK